MTGDGLHYSALTDVAGKIRSRALSPVALTGMMLRRIEQVDPGLHSYATVTAELARAQARQAEDELIQGRYRAPLHGVPIAVKDLCFTKGIATGCGTTILADWKPEITAPLNPCILHVRASRQADVAARQRTQKARSGPQVAAVDGAMAGRSEACLVR